MQSLVKSSSLTRSAHFFNNYNIDLRFKADSAKSQLCHKYSINRSQGDRVGERTSD